MGRRFLEVSRTAGFLFLPAERLCQLLMEDLLMVNSELDVFCALVGWLDHDRDNRLCHAAHLLQNAVRLHCLSPESIVTKVEPVDWLFDAVPDCLVVVNEAMRSVLLIRAPAVPGFLEKSWTQIPKPIKWLCYGRGTARRACQ